MTVQAPADAVTLADAVARSRALRGAGRAAEAIALLEPLARSAPRDAALHEQLGRARFELGEFDAAAAAFEAAFAAQPRASMLISLAAARLRAGAQPAARDACRQAIELEPRNPRAWLQAAVVGTWSFDPGELAAAEAAARTALGLDPALAAAHDARCIALRKLGRLEESLAAGRAALAQATGDPGAPGYAASLAATLLDAGRPAEAARMLAPYAAAAPGHLVAQRELGVAHARAGEAGPALAALDRALALDPGDQRAIAHRIVCHELRGELAAARALTGVGRFIREQPLERVPGYPDIAAFNRALADDIRAHPSLRYEPVGLAARGGSLAQDLLAHRTPAIDAFEAVLRARIADYQAALADDPTHPFLRAVPRDFRTNGRLSMWATLLDGGGEIATHIHDDSWLSGAYYVAVPGAVADDDPLHRGWFEYGHPGAAIAGHAPELGFVRPREGLLVMFPSYVYHRTVPFEAQGQLRISISFDLTPLGRSGHRGGAYR